METKGKCGWVARRLDDKHVAVEFEMLDGEVLEQIYHIDQFMDGLPQEGDRIYVLAWSHPPGPTDVSEYLTSEELKHGFPGFQKAIENKQNRV